jgi:tetratricopeptide (TPR) repeat protein
MSPSKLNNQAITLIQQGQYEEAISVLSKALKTLASLMRLHEAHGSINKNDVESSINRTTFDFVPTSEDSFWRQHEQPDVTVSKSSLCHRHILRDPIYVISSNELSPSAQACEILSFAVLYNLALCWHLWAVCMVGDDSSRRARLGKAQILYQHANNIMYDGRVEANSLHYMVMAIVCNIGHIYCCLGETKQAEASFQLLLSAVLCLVDSGACNDPKSLAQLEGFICSVLPIILTQQSAPAA